MGFGEFFIYCLDIVVECYYLGDVVIIVNGLKLFVIKIVWMSIDVLDIGVGVYYGCVGYVDGF